MDVVLVALVSLVLVALGVLAVVVVRLVRAGGAANSVAQPEIHPSSGTLVDTVSPASEGGALIEASAAASTHAADGGASEDAADIADAGAAGDAVGVAVSAAQVRAARAVAARIRADAQAEAAELRARAERESEQVRLHAQQAAAAIAGRAEADAALRVARIEAEAGEAARRAAEQARERAETRLEEQRAELRAWDTRLVRREAQVEGRLAGLDEQARRLSDREAELDDKAGELERKEADLAGIDEARRAALEAVAGMTAAEAKAELVKIVEQHARRDAAALVRDIEGQAREEGEQRARRIVTLAIQRIASEQTAESVVSVLHLPSDEMKGRIIGREGRNIRAFESVTGVNVLIDDTPEAVLLSCFDPVRREIGRIALGALVADGRIHPHRIEEEYQRARAEVDARCIRAGEDALFQTGIADMHPELVALLGRLRYRTSYGQNVLGHLVESAHLAAIMAAELRLPPDIAKRGTLLHDVGKALTHEIEGSHAIVGAEIARRYGEDEEVVHAIEAHHNEIEPRSIEAVLTQAADQISGGRPGARRDSLESYVKRLERIEQIAGERPGVEKVFAMQAGREVRVMVLPDLVDDLAAHALARDVAKQIEDELTYPGQIRVTVVRETRAVDTAR